MDVSIALRAISCRTTRVMLPVVLPAAPFIKNELDLPETQGQTPVQRLARYRPRLVSQISPSIRNEARPFLDWFHLRGRADVFPAPF